MTDPLQILSEYWGYPSFRPLQQEIITSVAAGHDTLALLPTGGGKSLCYQVPALMLPGTTLVVSPLIALMQDQVARLLQLNIPAACIHSGLSYGGVKSVLEQAVQGAYKLLYVSPERLQTRLFNDYAGEMELSLIAVDEAHCISQWGYDFRPDYLEIATLRESFPRIPVLALTASATPDVQTDIAAKLEMANPGIFRQSFARPNIEYNVHYAENKTGETIGETHDTTCGIVYCRSRRQTELIASDIVNSGVSSAAYHAGLDKEKRDEVQAAWMKNETKVIAATTAFGMGIDKPDVRVVVHYDSPEHLEAYYQEAGRAGRDGNPSQATLLYNSADLRRLEESTDLMFPAEAYLRQVYQAVAEYLQIPIGAQPDRYYAFDPYDFSAKFSFKTTNAIYALKLLEREGLWTLTEAVHSPATLQFTTDRYTLDSLEQANPRLYYIVTGILRMYSTVFHYPTHIREKAIARQLRLPFDVITSALHTLQQMEIVEYNRPGEGPQMFFHHYRVDSRHLLIDMKHINWLRARHIARTTTMIAFLQNTTECREGILLRYFGENVTADCGHCDVCRKKASPLTPEAEIANRLTELLNAEGEILLGSFTALFKPQDTLTAMNIIRQLADKGAVSLDFSGGAKKIKIRKC